MNIKDFKLNNPDYASVPDDQLASALHKKYYSSIPFEKFAASVGVSGPDPTGSFGENLLAGVGSGMTSLYRGTKQLFRIGDQEKLQREVDEAKRLDRPLDKTVGGFVGGIVGRAAPFAPAILATGPGVVGAGMIGGAQGALEQTASDESRLINTALGAGLGVAGQAAGNKLQSVASKRISDMAAARSQNALRDATLREGRQIGLTVPPSTVNPSATNTILEKIAGKAATQQEASLANQQVANLVSRAESAIPPNIPITLGALQQSRNVAGKAYEEVAKIGDILWDRKYISDLNRIATKHGGASKSFPDLVKPEVKSLVDGLNVGKFNSADAIEVVKQLRTDGFANRAAQGATQKSLGKAQVEAAEVIEELIERNLRYAGKQNIIPAYREARKQIAKTYSVENALNLGSGDVSSRSLGMALDKGEKLSGGLEKLAKFSLQFPKATQDAALIGSPVSHLDAVTSMGAGALGAAMTGGASGAIAAGIPLLRGPLRSMLLSSPYQRLMANPQYGIGLLSRMQPAVSPLLRYGSAPAGLLAYEGYQ